MSDVLLQATDIRKTYAGVVALRGVSFDLFPGEVHALVGENGAGKSTLIKVITGAVRPDAGTIAIDGRVVPHVDPRTARALGIVPIYQQPSLFPELTVAENIALGEERGPLWRRVEWSARRQTASRLLERVGASIDPDRIVYSLSMSEQQIVEIARAIGADARVLIMDEPTASLSEREVARLFTIIALLREQGVGIIYISHRLDEIFAVADRISVLRDGETVGTRARAEVDRPTLIRMMVGRKLSAVFPKQRVDIGEVVLEVRGLSHPPSRLHGISFSLRRGEILGLAGLVGSGRTELAEVLFGLRPGYSGEIAIAGVPAQIGSPADAIARGIGYLPEDRRRHGVILQMSIMANASLANLKKVARRGLIDSAVERRAAADHVQRLGIKTPTVLADVASLSGGNQQKVALARWLSIDPSVLVLDEPTQGVDVGSKAEIHTIMGELARRGVAILMISSEMPEIIAMSDRIAVMQHGTIRGILSREEATQHTILQLALGEASTSSHDSPLPH